MSKTSDWYPGTRDEQLFMGKDWVTVLTVSGTAWNVPQADTQELGTLVSAADSALTTAKNETTRTPVATARCKDAFDQLEAKMRDLKKRYFYAPPLTEADIISLGLKPHDTTHTPGTVPTAQVMAETYLAGRHELGVRIVYVAGNAGDKANKGYRIWYSVAGPNETPPAGPGDLRQSFYTQRKKDLIVFDYADSGKTAFFAIQIENDGKKGTWGPMVSALIP